MDMELIEALKIIREECNKHTECKQCPLRYKYEIDCSINSKNIYIKERKLQP